MIQSIQEVHSNFFELFRPQLPIDGGIPVYYAREAFDGISQKHPEVYPQCVILDYIPEFGLEWNTSYSKRFDGFSEPDNDDEKTYKKGNIYMEPLQLSFKYDVSVYTKSPKQRWSIMQHFLDTHGSSGSLVFNKKEISTTQEDSVVGDVVSYKVAPTEIPREDGVFELNYEFIITAFVSLPEKEYDTLRTLNINI